MEYAIQLLLPILGGLLLGFWLTEYYGVAPIWTVILAILGMVGGIGILYKRFSYPELYNQSPKRLEKTGKSPSTEQKLPVDQLDFLYKRYEDDDHEYKDDDDDKDFR